MSMESFKNAALRGDVEAQLFVAISYHTGQDCSRDVKQASQWYEMAAKQGNETAMAALALIYGNGDIGIRPDIIRAYAWAESAAPRLEIAAKIKEELSHSMTESQIHKANELAKSLLFAQKAESIPIISTESLQDEYERLLNRYGLRKDSLERPSEWFQDVLREIQKTDHAESPYATFKYYYPDIEARLKEVSLAGPGFLPIIEPISKQVEEALTHLGWRLPVRVLVREFPTASFNAHVHAIKGGAVILIHSGLFQFLNKAIKLMVALMDTVNMDSKGKYQSSSVSGHYAESLGSTEVTFDQIVALFSELIFAYLVGDFHYARRLPSSGGSDGIMRSRLLHACESFAIAHEYGHIIAGHPRPHETTFARTPVGVVEFSKKSHEQEFEADCIAAQLVFKANVQHENVSIGTVAADIVFTFTGALLFFALDGIVSDVEQELQKSGIIPITEQTHPHATQRAEALKKVFAKLVRDENQASMHFANDCEWWLSEVRRGIQEQIRNNAELWFEARVRNIYQLCGVDN